MGTQKRGARIRMYRERQGLTVAELAERSGMSSEYISSVEAGEIQPALGVMVKLARTLGTRLGTFMDDELTPDPLITRLKDRTSETVGHSGSSPSTDMVYHHLGRGKADRSMEPFFIRLEPQDNDGELSSHEGEEFIIVVSGEVMLRYGKETHILRAGDSMYYNSVVPHHVSAYGDSAAEIHAVIYVPA
ncbi:cupin domain-containing protein [Desulfobaculum bizertense]|uniref:Transcriptional regulator, XRE family with cupin sensor n=1 Tax=Desulfobaculum bizertense DSM 18034 TaxID=1121442 RepID=A0A1T4VDY5_9BACT|nr:cupin domain-containing protein [Desulfobaculum bizertense]UIJ37626.1 cupin domain-containing protein [Desulfobaculum bizertense]SKA63093.1 transcriptional regulator, XRE family with cupin sensor [Desulfobaculum bizertense DSM 18034]